MDSKINLTEKEISRFSKKRKRIRSKAAKMSKAVITKHLSLNKLPILGVCEINWYDNTELCSSTKNKPSSKSNSINRSGNELRSGVDQSKSNIKRYISNKNEKSFHKSMYSTQNYLSNSVQCLHTKINRNSKNFRNSLDLCEKPSTASPSKNTVGSN